MQLETIITARFIHDEGVTPTPEEDAALATLNAEVEVITEKLQVPLRSLVVAMIAWKREV